MAAMKENTLAILNYLKEVNGQKVTADDVAEALGLSKRSVIGSFNSFVKKGWGARIEAELEKDDGTHEKVKYLTLTADGLNFDPNAQAE